jgi:Alpha-(1,6)-fucosyltransferase N- and catalytic domains
MSSSNTPDQSSTIEAATAALHDRLDELQFRRSFEDSKFVVLDQDGYGFGAQFHRRVLGLQLAYMFDRTAVFVNEYNPPYAPCFKPTGQFTFEDIEHLPQENLDYTKEQQAKVAFFDFDSFWKDRSLRDAICEWVPPEIRMHADGISPSASKEKSWQDRAMWKLDPARQFFEGQLLSRFEYLSQYEAWLEELKRRIGFACPIIGVHIRRGDKKEETPYVPLRRYHAEILRAVAETGINRVFVSSDDPEVFAGLPGQDRVQYIYDDEEPRYNNANHRMLRERPELARQETFTALKIYDLLSHCDVLVGQNAHLTTLAQARNSARTMRAGEYRFIRGDYCTRFRYASPKDWGDVCSYKLRMLPEPIRRVMRPLKRSFKRLVDGA